jgi:SnoaL-like polyketide cyclase
MDNNKEAVLSFYTKALTVNNQTTPTKVLSEVLADNFTSYGSADSKGKPQLTGQVEFFWKLIPDLKWEPKDIINEGNKYVVRSLASGTPKGDFMGLPTDGTKSFNIMTIDVHVVENGKLQSVHHLEDWGTAMKQLKA